MMQLFNKHVPVNKLCPVCRNGEETVMHSLILCPGARECWRRVRINLQGTGKGEFGPWLAQTPDRMEKKQARLLTMICWTIWNAMNDWVWNKKTPYVDNIVESTKIHLEQWLKAHESGLITPSGEPGDGTGNRVMERKNGLDLKMIS